MAKEFGMVVLLGVIKKPSPALLYACRHWDYHLTHGLLGSAIRGCLKSLKFKTLVGWIRTLGEVGELNRISSALLGVRDWLKVRYRRAVGLRLLTIHSQDKPEASAPLIRRFKYIEFLFKSAKTTSNLPTPADGVEVDDDEVDESLHEPPT